MGILKKISKVYKAANKAANKKFGKKTKQSVLHGAGRAVTETLKQVPLAGPVAASVIRDVSKGMSVHRKEVRDIRRIKKQKSK